MPPPGLSSAPISKPGRKSGSKGTHSRSYPRGVGLDFRKLAGLTLVSYIDHHGKKRRQFCVVSSVAMAFVLVLTTARNTLFSPTGVKVRAEAPPSELAVAVARHFEQMEVDEEDCIGGFLERLHVGTGGTSYSRKTQYFDGHRPTSKRKRTKWAARPGEQVAAKVTRTDENGSWILASVQRFYADTQTYDVQDEDDISKLIRLPWSHVMRLSTGTEGCFQKGADCMAIFPETTSFYKAKVSKSPIWKLDHGNPTVKEIIVKFEDDEDGSGKTPHRRVPSRYVIPVPSQYFYEEAEDVDLTPLANTNK